MFLATLERMFIYFKHKCTALWPSTNSSRPALGL